MKGQAIRALPQQLTLTGALALALYLLVLVAAGSEQAHAAEDDEFVAGQVIVKLNSDSTSIGDFLSRYEGAERLDVIGEDLPQYNLELMDIYLLKPPPGNDVTTFVSRLIAEKASNGVIYAEPNYIAETPKDPSDNTFGDARFKARVGSKYSSEANTTYDDLDHLDLSCAREDFKGTRVAVLDTGAQLNHSRLVANFRKVKRYDFVDDDGTPSDEQYYLNGAGQRVKGQLAGHGTHVTGIVDQVAPGAKIMPLRVLDPDGRGSVYTVARAINFAMMDVHNVAVINLSLGTSKHS